MDRRDHDEPDGREPAPRRRTTTGWLAALAVLLVAAAGAAFAFGLLGRGEAEEAAAEEERAVPVVVAPVRRDRVEDTVATVGEVFARQAVMVTSEVSGRVTEVPVADGSQVEAGEVIARLDDARERAALAAAQARADEARLQFERTRALTRRDFAAEAQLDEREAALKTAEAEVTQAREAVERRTIRAPFPGNLGFLAVDPGTVVEPGAAIVQLTTPPPVRLRFRLPSRFLAGLDLGDAVRGGSPAFPGEAFAGRVAAIDPAVDRDSRNFTAEADLDDPRRRLRPGLFLDATVVLAVREGALVVPEVAVLFEGPTSYVYRVDGEERARRAPVRLGSRGDGKVEVVVGLEEDQRVVVEGVQRLSDGTPVEPREGGDAPAGAGAGAGAAS